MSNGAMPGDLLNLLQVGVQQAIDDGIEGEPTTNALAALLGLLGLSGVTSLGGGSGLGLSSITDLAEGLVGNALGSSLQSQGVPQEALKTTSFESSNAGSTSTGSGQTLPLTTTVVGFGTTTGTTGAEAPVTTVTKSARPRWRISSRTWVTR